MFTLEKHLIGQQDLSPQVDGLKIVSNMIYQKEATPKVFMSKAREHQNLKMIKLLNNDLLFYESKLRCMQ